MFVNGTYIGEAPSTATTLTRSTSTLAVSAKAASTWTRGKTFHTTLRAYKVDQSNKKLAGEVGITLYSIGIGYGIGAFIGTASDIAAAVSEYIGAIYPNHKTPKGKYVSFYYTYKIIGSGWIEYEVHYNFYRNSNYTGLQASVTQGPATADLN